MVSDVNIRVGYERFIENLEEPRNPAEGMMLQDTKFFPGHPNNMGQAAYNNSFTRKDIFNQRKQREFIPEAKKDDCYWDRRRRNNEAAKRSREKRRLNDMLLETRVIELSKDNHIMKCQLNAVFEKYGIKGENLVSMEQVMSTMPSNDHILSITKKRLGPIPGMREASPSPVPFHNLRLPQTLNNNNGGHSSNNNNNEGSVDLNRSCSPERETSPSPAASYHSSSPVPVNYHSALPSHTNLVAPIYNDIRNFAESGHMYRGPGAGDRAEGHRYTEIERTDEDRDSEKDSGLALNLSTDRAGSDGSRDTESGRSSTSGSPPVTSSNIQDGASSGDESGYPRSPNSSGSGEAPSNLPHKLRFKSVVGEKEAVSSLLSLRQMALIKREPVDHITRWIESAAASAHGNTQVGLLASLLPHAGTHFKSIDKVREENEPSQKRIKLPSFEKNNINDEVARLSSEVATLKNLLVNRMKDEEEEQGAETSK